MRGRRPTSKVLQELGGTAIANQLTDGSPPVMPEWLTGRAAVEWQRIVPELARCGLALGVDVAMLASYCQAYDEWVQATLEVREDGMTIVDIHGNRKMHPASKIADAKAAEMRRIAQDFGFSPASRYRIKNSPTKSEETGQLDEFLRS